MPSQMQSSLALQLFCCCYCCCCKLFAHVSPAESPRAQVRLRCTRCKWLHSRCSALPFATQGRHSQMCALASGGLGRHTCPGKVWSCQRATRTPVQQQDATAVSFSKDVSQDARMSRHMIRLARQISLEKFTSREREHSLLSPRIHSPHTAQNRATSARRHRPDASSRRANPFPAWVTCVSWSSTHLLPSVWATQLLLYMSACFEMKHQWLLAVPRPAGIAARCTAR